MKGIPTAAVALLAGAATSMAATISFEEGASPTPAYTHQGAVVRNDASNSTVVNNGNRLLAGTVGTGALRTLLSFDISAIPAGSTINSVTFSIYQEADTSVSVAGNYTVELRSVSQSFDETTATWSNTFNGGMTLGGSALSSLTMDPEVAAITQHTFASSSALVALVQSAADGAQAVNLALLVPSVENGGSRVVMRFGADNSSFPLETSRPALTVDYTPVPEPVSLTMLGLGALICRRRRPL